jgi:hypothetical protein
MKVIRTATLTFFFLALFSSNHIDVEMFMTLSAEELFFLGVQSFGARRMGDAVIYN